MIGLALSLALEVAATTTVFVDDRAELPWIVVAQAGSRCGATKSVAGPRSTRAALIAALAKTPETTPPTKPEATKSLPLLLTPGLFGLEGEVIVAAARLSLQKSNVVGAVALRFDANGAFLDVPAAAAAVSADFSAAEFDALVKSARSSLAQRRATIGDAALAHARAASCNVVGAEDNADWARRLRTRFAVALR